MFDLPQTNTPFTHEGQQYAFTPGLFPLVWDAKLWPLLQTLSAEGAGGGFDFLLQGCGRVAPGDYFSTDSTKPHPTEPSSLGLVFPATTYFVADAEGQIRRVTLSDEADLLDIPAAMTMGRYGYVRAVQNEDSNEVNLDWYGWSETLKPQWSAAGYACIGKVTTGADSVTSYSKAGSDVVGTMPLLLKVLETLLATGSEGGGSGGAASLDTLPKTLTDPTPALTYIDGRLDDLEAQVAANAPANILMPPPLIQLGRRLAQTQTSVAELSPHSVERSESSIIVQGAGEGSNDTPNFSPTTGHALEAILDIETGRIGPA